MPRRGSCSQTRRHFLAANAAAMGSCLFQRQAFAADLPPAFHSCVDYPIRINDNHITSVDMAAAPAADRDPSVPRPAQHPAATAIARAIPSLPANAPSDSGRPPRLPAQMAQLNRWEKSKLRVSFLGGDPNLQDRVLNLAKEWSTYANIDFELADPSDPLSEIKVNFLPNKGHWSYVGIEAPNQGGIQTMNLQFTNDELLKPGEYNHGVVLHEFGHALGCLHEHLSPASGLKFKIPQIYDYYKPLHWTKEMVDTNVINRYQASDLIRFSEFDRLSIMTYDLPAYVLENNDSTQANNQLSEMDKKFISLLYPGRWKPGGNDSGNGTTDPNKPDPNAKKESSKELKLKETASGVISSSTPKAVFKMHVSDAGMYFIKTQGYTQVKLSVYIDDTKGTLLEAKDVTTPDLVNVHARFKLNVGDYRLEVTHKHERGGGEFAVSFDNA